VEFSVAALDQDAPTPRGVTRQPDAARGRPAPDFTIELVTNDGAIFAAPASRFAEIPPPLKETFTKFAFLERDQYVRDWEPVFQTVRAPLSAFASVGGRNLDPQSVVVIRLRFDRTASGVICVSGIGFGSD